MKGLLKPDGTRAVTLSTKNRTISTVIVECADAEETQLVTAGMIAEGYAVTAPRLRQGILDVLEVVCYKEVLTEGSMTVELGAPH